MRARVLCLVAMSIAAHAVDAGVITLVGGGEVAAPDHAPLAPALEAELRAEIERNLRRV